mmetsp:Transcript_16187/g.61688  ORF Transcript_16187/g.61688 Transcript_16187/m.61688 type:complete len:221 (+) Transcript_16187:790-1452(+)
MRAASLISGGATLSSASYSVYCAPSLAASCSPCPPRASSASVATAIFSSSPKEQVVLETTYCFPRTIHFGCCQSPDSSCKALSTLAAIAAGNTSRITVTGAIRSSCASSTSTHGAFGYALYLAFLTNDEDRCGISTEWTLRSEEESRDVAPTSPASRDSGTETPLSPARCRFAELGGSGSVIECPGERGLFAADSGDLERRAWPHIAQAKKRRSAAPAWT